MIKLVEYLNRGDRYITFYNDDCNDDDDNNNFINNNTNNHTNDMEETPLMTVAYIFSCDQAALWMVQSVCPSVCPSVCLSVCLSHLFDYVPIILSSWNFQELLPVTKVTSMQKVKVRGQRSRSQRSQPNLTVSGL